MMIILNQEQIVIYQMKEIWIGLLCCKIIGVLFFIILNSNKFSYDSEKHDCNSFIGTWENIAHK